MNEKASNWLENNWKQLIRDYNNQWIGASSEGYVGGVGETFDLALAEIQAREISLSDVVFVYLTDEAIQ